MNETIRAGDLVPDIQLTMTTVEGPRPVGTGELLGEGTVVLFGVPGAFTSTCSDTHLPGFLSRADDLADAGADRVVCMAVNDAAVMTAWAKATGATGHVTMLADGNGELTRALGLALDLSAAGMGERTRRFAAILDDGVVRWVGVEPGREVGISSAAAVLERLRTATG